MNNEVLYVAKRTMITRKFVWSIVAFIIGIIVLILGFVTMKSGPYIIYLGLVTMAVAGIFALCEALVMHSNSIEFYKTKYVIKSGVINKHENEAILTNLVSVSISQSLGGSIFDYGTVKINVVGKHDISLTGVKHPHELKKYIESLMDKTNMEDIKQVIHE